MDNIEKLKKEIKDLKYERDGLTDDLKECISERDMLQTQFDLCYDFIFKEYNFHTRMLNSALNNL